MQEDSEIEFSIKKENSDSSSIKIEKEDTSSLLLSLDRIEELKAPQYDKTIFHLYYTIDLFNSNELHLKII